MDEMQGVMSLPEAQGPGMRPEDMAIFEEIRRNVPRQEITKEFLDAGAQADPQAVAEFKQELAGLELTPDELNKLNTMVDAILAAPQDYASLRRAYLAEGMPEDLLPEQFDPAFFAALNMAIDTIAMNPGSPPPMAMARGGVADLAAYGRNGDTMLAHITPQEAAMLKRMGGSGTINPYTGLPEYASIFKKIGKAVKKFAKSTVGKILIGAALFAFAGPAAAGFLSGAAGSVGLTGLSGFLTSQVGIAAVSGFVAGAGSTLAAGGNLKQALKAGAVGGITAGAMSGISGAIQGTNNFAAPSPLPGTPPPGVAAPIDNLTAPPTGVGTAADIVGTSDRIPGVSPFGSQVSQQTIPAADNSFGIDVRPTPRAPLADPRFGGNFVSQVDRFGAEIPLDTGSLTPNDLTGEVARNTGQGTYSGRQFNPASAGRGPILEPPHPELSASGDRFSTMARNAFDKTVDFFNPNATSPDALAKAMQAGEAAQNASYTRELLRLGVDNPESLTEAQRMTLLGKTKDAYDIAYKAAMPGAFTRYAPLAALGVGALGAMGAFKAQEAPPLDTTMFRGPSPQQLAAARLNYGGIRPTAYGGYYSMPGYAEGGGVMDTPQAMRVGGKTYPRKTGAINGPGTGTSDSIPAMLSDGEFVFTAKAVRAMGNGSRRKGAKKMYKLMKMLEGKAA